MKKYKLFFIIYTSFLSICILSLIILAILGSKSRIGYLGDFKFDGSHIIRTLELNGLTHIKENYIIDGKLDEESIKNFIFTNESITQYSYGCRVKYYDKVFRNSDIYGVYVDTNKAIQDNDFIKEINISNNGSPFGSLISTKIIDFEKIDNINYVLSLKNNIGLLFIFLYIIFIFLSYKKIILSGNNSYKLTFYIILFLGLISVIFILKINILYSNAVFLFIIESICLIKYHKNIYKLLDNLKIFNNITLCLSFILLIFLLFLSYFVNFSLKVKYIILFVYLNIFFVLLGIFLIKKFNLLLNLKNLFYIFIFIFLFNINCSYNYLNANNDDTKFLIFFVFSLILSSFFFIFYLYSEYKHIKIEKIFLISFTIIGLSYMIFLPYSEVPDESSHFFRAYEISQGHLMSDKNDMNYGGRIFESDIKNMYIRVNSYSNLLSNISKPKTISDTKEFIPFPGSALYSFISYFPQSLGMWVGNLFNVNYLILAYFGRLFNFIFFVIVTYLSIIYIPIKKISLYFITFLPIIFQESISLAVDPIIISTSFLLIAICLDIKFRDENNNITLKEIILLYLLIVFISCSKITYLPICFIVLIIPKSKFRRNGLVIIISLLILSIVLNMICLKVGMSYSNQKWTDSINEVEQIKFVLNNIFDYLYIFFNTLFRNVSDYFDTMIGRNLSWFDIHIPYFSYYINIILFIIFFIFDNNNYSVNFNIKSIIFIIVSITIGLIFTALYVSWTPVANKIVLGIQGRYFLPILLYILILFSNKLTKLDFNLINNYIFIVLIMINILVLNEIFNKFYI